jgi:anti-sigma factor RsiW
MDDPDRYRLLMMGYIDDELALDERREFVARCFEDEALARELAEQLRIARLAASVRFREPSDAEYERAIRGVVHRCARQIGAALMLLGALSLGGLSLLWFARTSMPLEWKLATAAVLTGFLVYAGAELQARRRVLRLDRYQGISR